MNNNAAIDATFAKEWLIDGAEALARYRYKDDKHILKTHDNVLNKGVICINPNYDEFEVVSSKRVSTHVYEHILQPLNSTPQQDWTPSR